MSTYVLSIDALYVAESSAAQMLRFVLPNCLLDTMQK
uniref:PIN domain nuclease n=1 Tax=Heterorhabditis bacteriophora TaxID=37862 RepID=A0A1I7X2P2_HETBA